MNRILNTFICLISFLVIVSFAQSEVTYLPSDAKFPNPERGFYTHTEGWNDAGALTASQLSGLKSKNQTLILRMYYIPKWRNADLPATFLNMLQKDFNTMRQYGVKCILRFAYSNAIGTADAPLSVVLNHLEQLKLYLQANYDVIAFMQAGFIGAWGEWHSSTNNLDNTSSRSAILKKILEVLPPERMAQVRTPYFKQSIFNNYNPLTEEQAFTQTEFSRTGHHNDCFLASEDDYGTYQDTTKDKTYISLDTRFVPIGGETCNPTTYSECVNAIYQVQRLHWTYVNSNYHQTVLGNWQKSGCYDEFVKKLGYRFELIDGQFTDSTKPNGTLSVKLKIRNTGHASLYNPRDVEMILRNETDTFFVKLDTDPRWIMSGDTVEIKADLGIPSGINPGNYELLLNLPDPLSSIHYNPTYSIRLANMDLWEQVTGYNKLNVVVNINQNNSSPDYTGIKVFEPLTIPTSVEDERKINRLDYKLKVSNYPNPFNNETKIVYNLDRAGDATLKIYNMLGQEIQTLVNETQDIGEYEVDFSTDNLSSGIYFYVLKIKSQVATGKMILLK